MNLIIKFLVILLVFSQCQTNLIETKSTNQFAELFKIEKFKNERTIFYRQKNQDWHSVSFKNIPNAIIILSSSHAGFINELGLQKKVVAVSNKKYFYDSYYQSSSIAEVGDMDQLNLEKILKIQPDLIFIHPNSLPKLDQLKILDQAKIKYIITNEYQETNALGQAEWIKLYGSIFNLSEKSDSIFQYVSEQYQKIATQNYPSRPKVMTGYPWKSQWFVSSYSSLFSQFIYHAGGQYIVDSNWSGNTPLGIEQILKISQNAQFWINVSDVKTIEKIKTDLSYSKLIIPLKLDQCFNNNLYTKASGSNNYWEKGIVRPDLILSDIFYILHKKSTDSSLFFYKKIE